MCAIKLLLIFVLYSHYAHNEKFSLKCFDKCVSKKLLRFAE